MSYNPDLEHDDTHRRWVVHPPPGSVVVKIGYEDNRWLSATSRTHIDHLRITDRDAYEHIYGGKCRTSVKGALWNRAVIDNNRVSMRDVPAMMRVVVAIDPAVTANDDSDETGIGCVGLSFDGHLFVFEDKSQRASPLAWGRAAINLLAKWNGDRIVGEINNGGDLVEGNLRAIDPNVPFRSVHATRGKIVRAEPVAALYERGVVHHVGFEDAARENLAPLEYQLCNYAPDMGMKSPDRMDWLVWAITDLVVNPPTETYRVTEDVGYQISPY